MVSLDEAVIARISKAGQHFEIYVDSDRALAYRKGQPYGIENILAARVVFRDAKKGDRAPDSDLKKAFGTSDVLRVAEEIIRHGEIQLTTEHRRKLVAERTKEVADIISKQGMDPKTNLPHPPNRIMNAMEQAHVNVDPSRPAKDQIKSVLEKIQPIIPISIQNIEVAIKVPMQYASKASAAVRGFAVVKKEEWKPDAWYAIIEIPAGMQGSMYGRLNELTAGAAEVKAIKKSM